jgi:hypothetical protein
MTADDASSRAVWSVADGVLAPQFAPRAFAIECSTLYTTGSWSFPLKLRRARSQLRRGFRLRRSASPYAVYFFQYQRLIRHSA